MEHEQFIEPKTAELAKKAGFDWKVYACYYKSSPDKVSTNGTLSSNFNGYAFQHIATSAPTQSVLQRWLREVKNVVLLVDFNNDEDCEENERYGVTIYTGRERIVELATYPTYEEALEAGLQNYLTNL